MACPIFHSCCEVSYGETFLELPAVWLKLTNFGPMRDGALDIETTMVYTIASVPLMRKTTEIRDHGELVAWYFQCRITGSSLLGLVALT